VESSRIGGVYVEGLKKPIANVCAEVRLCSVGDLASERNF
jgi:hypothetical protein